MIKKTLTLAILTTLTLSANANTFFSDNFEATQAQTNRTPDGWSMASGTVDTVGPGYFAELCNGSGTCIDLDGSTNNAGELSRSFSLVAGSTYQLAFDLAGNRRGRQADTVTVSFGTASMAYSMTNTVSTAPYQHFTLDFTPVNSGSYTLMFANAGGDNVGAILDNVSISVTAVPEPQTYAMMALGLAALALVRRRRAA